MGAGVMGLMSVWVAGLESECTGQFGGMSNMMPPQVQRALETGAPHSSTLPSCILCRST